MHYRYMDDTFVVLSSKDKCNLFLHSLNSLHPSLCFTFEKESDLALPFLDVLVKKSLPGSLPLSTVNPHSAVNIYAGIRSLRKNTKVT